MRTHHEKFFNDLKAKANADLEKLNEPSLTLLEQAQLALKAAKGNKAHAARLLGWTRCKLRWALGEGC